MELESKKFLCIGHRGAMGYAPQNTLASVRKALEFGAPCLEVDVYYVDNHLIVFHDERLELLTNGTGYVFDKTFPYLRSLNAGDGERIPTLEEVFETVNFRAGVNVELKGPGTAGPVVDLIQQLRKQNNWSDDLILVSSFNHRELAEVRRLDCGIKLGALIVGLPADDAAFAASLNAYSVHASLEFVDQRFVKDAHVRGLKVFVFTVNHPEDIDRMKKLGVDGIFTNFPDRVLRQSQGLDISVVGWK